MDAYYAFKACHYLGIILLAGNITVTAVWKVFADRNGDWRVVRFGQQLVTGTDFGLTMEGIVLTMVGGYGAAWLQAYPLFESQWLVWSQILFVVAGAIWLGILVPIQVRQARMVARWTGQDDLNAEYRRLSRRWIAWGLISTVPLCIILWLMVAKPH